MNYLQFDAFSDIIKKCACEDMEETEDVVIIPIKPKETESFVCKFYSVTLKSLNKLEKHKEQMNEHGKDKLFYCSE